VDAGNGEGASTVERGQRWQHQVADRSEKDGGVEWLGRLRISFAHAGSTEFESEVSRFGRPSHDVNSCPFCHGDLGCEMG
jgi:hypothetical protein